MRRGLAARSQERQRDPEDPGRLRRRAQRQAAGGITKKGRRHHRTWPASSTAGRRWSGGPRHIVTDGREYIDEKRILNAAIEAGRAAMEHEKETMAANLAKERARREAIVPGNGGAKERCRDGEVKLNLGMGILLESSLRRRPEQPFPAADMSRSGVCRHPQLQLTPSTMSQVDPPSTITLISARTGLDAQQVRDLVRAPAAFQHERDRWALRGQPARLDGRWGDWPDKS